MTQLKYHLNRLLHHGLSLTYFALIILTIPLAFNVGGVSCGLAFSYTIFCLDFFLTTVKIFAKRSRYLRWISIFYYCQHPILPSLLTLFLSYYNSNDEKKSLHLIPINAWRLLIVNATPVFTIAEGFCSLLVIQAVGQIISWLTIHKSDSWLIISLVASGSTITGALYFLYRIYVLPFTIDLISASLLGSVLTLTVSVGLFGIVSGKGSIIESALLFAYIVRCVYETFPNLSEDASKTILSILSLTTKNLQNEIPKLTPQITNTALQLLPFLAANLPGSIRTIWEFNIMAIHNLTLPLLIDLAYRIGVFYAATKIIPSLYDVVPSTSISPRSSTLERRDSSTSLPTESNFSATESPGDKTDDIASKYLKAQRRHGSRESSLTMITIIYTYSPCILIAVYTHLMMLYNAELGTELKLWRWWSTDTDKIIIVHPWQFWHWINMGTTLLLYTAELLSNDGNNANSGITSNWRVE